MKKSKAKQKMFKKQPFATKSGTNAKMALFSGLSIASSIVGATWINRKRQPLSIKALAKSAEKFRSQIEKASNTIDLRDHPRAGEAMNQAGEKLDWMSRELEELVSAGSQSAKPFAHADDGS